MNESSPKISIILPTYDGAKYIRRSIESCLNQTYKNIELIIVDDGSTDQTYQIVTSYKDKRLKYIRHNENKGLPHALNTGFAKAAGEYLTWTSDDNCYANKAIEKMLSFLKDKQCSFVFCDYYRFNEEKPSSLKIVRLPDVPTLENQNDIGACFLYSRRVKEVIGDYDPDAALAEDYDYWIRVSKKFSMCHLAEPLYIFRKHATSLSSRFLRQYDIQIVSLLVVVKNNILDVEQATKQFIRFITEKKMASRRYKPFRVLFFIIKLITFKRIDLSESIRVLARFQFSTRIDRILRNFQKGRISFKNAKFNLKNIIEKESQNLQFPFVDKFYQAAKTIFPDTL
jgi:glycosyltransferase involved in cell wall biosynthesis